MKKIKEIWGKYEGIILGVGAVLLTGLIAFFGFERGVKKSNKARKEAEIDSLKSKASEKIMKEKLEDSKKDIHEISSEVDDLLNDK